MRPLDGIRVLDLSRLLPGPTCTWYLQGLGADVVKVESPEAGDPLRHLPPFGPDGLGAWFTAINGGKRSVALDLREPSAVRALRALIADADVVVEGFRPGKMAAFGLDPAALIADEPRLVVASISGYGQTGEWSARPGHDLSYAALAGLLPLTPVRDDGPDLPGLPLADLAGGALTAALRIAAALFARERTGRGAWLDVSMTDGVVGLMAPVLTATALQSTDPVPGGELLTGGAANYRLYRCADDGWIAFPPLEPKLWSAFEAALGEELPLDADALAERFRSRPRDEWAKLLADASVTPVLLPTEVLEHALHRARGTIVGSEAATRVVPPFSGAPSPAPAPQLGEHTAQELTKSGVDPATLSTARS